MSCRPTKSVACSNSWTGFLGYQNSHINENARRGDHRHSCVSSHLTQRDVVLQRDETRSDFLQQQRWRRYCVSFLGQLHRTLDPIPILTRNFVLTGDKMAWTSQSPARKSDH